MRKDNLKKMLLVKLQIFFAALVLGFMLADCVPAYAAEEDLPQPAGEEYRTQYDDAVKLAEMLRQSPYLLYNKTYTAEQEGELQAVVDSVCGGESTDRGKAEVLLDHIRKTLEPGESYELNGWDTLCDGDAEVTIEGILENPDKTILKRQANQSSWCFTFYDVCRLADIPCFILEDCRGINSQELYNKYICMVYIEKASGTGKEWHFVNVMEENGEFVTAENAYEVIGDRIFPMNIFLDYNKTISAMNVIFLNKETMLSYSGKTGIVPFLAYDCDTDTVKTYFKDGTLANEEQYCRTVATVGEDGEAPSGWIESRIYSGGEMTTYLLYSMHGVFLRGRVDKDGTEYDLQEDFFSNIPYNVEMGSEAESEEHKKYRSEYKQELENKAVKVAEALLKDENYIWDDVNFTEEDEALIKEAVETALDWDYITGNAWSVSAFEAVGISLEEENPEALSDKAKAQAILCYIKRNVESVDHTPLNVTSAWVLRNGIGTCDGITLLYRDMCVTAGVPCFMSVCSIYMSIEDSLFADHGNNLVKVGDEWLFVDPTNASILGVNIGYQIALYEAYSTAGKTINFLDCEALRKNNYSKWQGYYLVADYYAFDSEGNLGIYHRNRFGEPIVTQDKTDENGKYLLENGLHTIDLKETSEDGKAEVVNRYAYYYQNLKMLQGEKVIDGKEYHFGEDANYSYYHKVEEVSRKYIIAYLDFQPMENQPYHEGGVCPVPEIYHGDKKLELGKDFKITGYTNNKEVTSYVDAGYQVEGIGDYTGSAIRYFKIVQADISELDAELSETSYVWTPGTNYYKPEVKLDLNWQDYDVAYYDYNKPGTAKVVITGKRNYKGFITKYYNIAQRVWNEEDFQILDMYGRPLQSQELSYNFSSVKPEAKVYWFDEEGNGYALSVSDYDISYSNFDEPGIATVTATAKGDYYRGSVSCTYKIKQYDIGDNSGVKQLMSMSHSPTQKLPKVYYTGSPVMPIIPDFNNLEKDVHYTMTVADNVNVGIAKITLQGIGVCTGTYVKEFEVVPCVLSENAISVEYRYTTYNGQVQKPSVTIKTDLVEGRDYFITYEKEVDGEYQETEPKEVGEYWVAVHVTDNVLIRQAGVSSDADAPDCYYISYSINGDGSESGNSGTGSGAGDSGSSSGSSGTGSGTGDSGSGSGSSGTGSGTGDSGSGSGSSGMGSGTGSSGSGSESSGTGSGTGSSGSGAGDTNAVSEPGANNVSSGNTTNRTAYKIKNLKLISMNKAIKMKWTKVKNAKGYQIQISLHKKYKKAKTICVKKSKKSYTLKKLKKNKKYYIRIRAYGKEGNKKVYGKWRAASKKTK